MSQDRPAVIEDLPPGFVRHATEIRDAATGIDVTPMMQRLRVPPRERLRRLTVESRNIRALRGRARRT